MKIEQGGTQLAICIQISET